MRDRMRVAFSMWDTMRVAFNVRYHQYNVLVLTRATSRSPSPAWPPPLAAGGVCCLLGRRCEYFLHCLQIPRSLARPHGQQRLSLLAAGEPTAEGAFSPAAVGAITLAQVCQLFFICSIVGGSSGLPPLPRQGLPWLRGVAGHLPRPAPGQDPGAIPPNEINPTRQIYY